MTIQYRHDTLSCYYYHIFFKKNSIFGKHQQILYLLLSCILLKQIGNYTYDLF